MKNKRIFFSLFILLIAVFFFISQTEKEVKSVCINEKCFSVEIADENYEKVLGLSNRDSLNENQAMLFIFKEETIKRAKEILKSSGALFSYHAESDWYVLDGCIGRANGDGNLKILAHPKNREGLEKLTITLGLPK